MRGSDCVPRHQCRGQAGQDLRSNEGDPDELRHPIALIGLGNLPAPGNPDYRLPKAALIFKTHQDTHIALVTSPAYTNDDSKYVIVEVTPRTRQRYHFPSTATLKKQILHKRVMVTGWLFYDAMHTGNAANTNPNGKKIWRATCEEIHPVSGIKVLH